jgi:hypothetical protein
MAPDNGPRPTLVSPKDTWVASQGKPSLSIRNPIPSPMGSVQCPFCKRRSARILEHLAISHNIGSPGELADRTHEKERLDKEAAEFRIHSDTLKAQMSEGKLTAEEYRRLIVAWATSHSWQATHQ